VAQYYEADVNKEHVIRGNAAVIKCLIPSFVADFVEVVSWHADEEESYFPGTEYVVSQFYITEAENEYVIRGNAAVVKCKIPSFVADFVQVEAWVDDGGVELWRNNATAAYVVHQFYQTRVIDEFVLRGNAATLKCLVPSFVADFIDVEAWIDEEGVEIQRPLPTESTVVKQFFESQVYDEYVIKGNAAIFKCQTPSFVADHIDITDWIDTEGEVYTKNIT
ncbi:Hypothetical predicted protein, partial [Drosophila guanche]